MHGILAHQKWQNILNEQYFLLQTLLFCLSLKSMFLFCVCLFFTVIITPDLLIFLNDPQNFLIYLLSRYVGINATEINHSAGRYHPGQSPPLEAGLEVRVKKIWSQDPLKHPYMMEPCLTATSLLWPPCFGRPAKWPYIFL